jgi:cytochrome P450
MLPPGPRQPSVVQLVEFTRRPLAWLEECGRRYGDPFTARIPGYGPFVFAAAPALIKEIFTGDDEVLQAGKANAILQPLVGSHSVLLLDGPPHLRQRRLLSPPLRGERMQAYAGLIAEIAAAEVERMPRDRAFAIHGHMQAITLDVILRAVFGVEEGARLSALRRMMLEVLEAPPAFLLFLPVKYRTSRSARFAGSWPGAPRWRIRCSRWWRRGAPPAAAAPTSCRSSWPRATRTASR